MHLLGNSCARKTGQANRHPCVTIIVHVQVKQYVPEIMKAVVSLPEQQVCGAIGMCSAADLSGARDSLWVSKPLACACCSHPDMSRPVAWAY